MTTLGTRQRERGAVLLEVVLALMLFVAAATIVSTGMNSAVTALDRLRSQTHGLNLARSVISEAQLGLRPLQAAGPEAFDAPFEEWTWEMQVESMESGSMSNALKRIEVVIRNEQNNATYRLGQIVPEK